MQPNKNSNRLEKRYRTDIKSAQGVGAMSLILTLINVIFLLISKSYFYFDTAVTHSLLKLVAQKQDFEESIALPCIGIALYLALYIVGILLSQKNPKNLWILLVLYSIDTAVLLITEIFGVFEPFEKEDIIDMVFHVFLMLFLIVGVRAVKKLKDMGLDPKAKSAQTK